MFTGDSSTGSKSIVWRENPADGGNNESGTVHNPNSGDDSRLSQHASNIVIMSLIFNLDGNCKSRKIKLKWRGT